MRKLPPAPGSRIAANTDGSPKVGQHNQSIDPVRDTSAAVRPSPSMA
jgi:hypothetical protein